MATANSIIDHIPKIATGILLLGLFAGASYSSAYWQSFGLNPYHYAELSYIAASAFTGLLHLGMQLIGVSIVFIMTYKIGVISIWKEITQNTMKLERWKADIEKTTKEVNECSQTINEMSEKDQKRIEAMQSDMATMRELEEELQKRQDNLQDEVRTQLTSIKKPLWKTIFYLVGLSVILWIIASLYPSFNHLFFVSVILISVGALVCLLTLFSATQSTFLSQGHIPEAMVSGIAIFFIWLSSHYAGQASAHQITDIVANKVVYTDSAKKQYYYLGTLGEYIMLYDPCDKKTTAKLKTSEPTFTVKNAATISIC